MKTSVVGFPRIGALRELKFASEHYFKGEISQGELLETAESLRKAHWATQRAAGVDFIPSNDFSFYDGLLDTANLFNIVPARYRALGLSTLDTYFAQARGYQGENGDVKALAMKKWFNTNYHYMVPEVEDDTEIRPVGTKIFDEYAEAKVLGIETKPVLNGAFTLLKLCRFTGTKTLEDFVDATIAAYSAVFDRANAIGVKFLQIDEPFLVFDLTADDIALFERLYAAILSRKGGVKIILQTYFGDIRDIYATVTAMPFDAIGLDFVEGRETSALVKKFGFPREKLLFAGLINGKNIWKNHYEKTLGVLGELEAIAPEVVLSTSCSLAFVPYTLENESAMPAEFKKHFAFAHEKLAELADLKTIVNGGGEALLAANKALFAEGRNVTDAAVQARVAAITPEDTVRHPAFAEREKIQKAEFGLPLFPTTTIGSFPQTKEVKANRAAFKRGKISREEYVAFNRRAIAECVRRQEEIGLDVLVHGEFERNDMVEYFGELLSGFIFTQKAWVQSYGTRCVKPPIIWGDISRPKPMTVEWISFAQSQTKRPLKGMLTGPVTILNWSFPREDIPVKESVFQLALAIGDEVLDLEKAGIRIIQVDEAALREKLPLRKTDWQRDYLDWAIPAFRLVHSRCRPETQIHTHMCYSEFNDIIRAIDDMDADVITFEAARSDLRILDALAENNFRTEVGPGVYDIHSPRVPSKDEIVRALHKIVAKTDVRKVWVNPDCGLKTRDNRETWASLANLVAAAKELRHEFDGRF